MTVRIAEILSDNIGRFITAILAGIGHRISSIVPCGGIRRILAALFTVVAQRTAMQLQNLTAARRLMQPVNVLRDDGFQLALRFPLRQLSVGGVGLRSGQPQLFMVKAIVFLRVFLKKRVGQNLLRRILVFLIVKPVHAAEIRDAALRRDAGAAEKHDVVAAVDELL